MSSQTPLTAISTTFDKTSVGDLRAEAMGRELAQDREQELSQDLAQARVEVMGQELARGRE